MRANMPGACFQWDIFSSRKHCVPYADNRFFLRSNRGKVGENAISIGQGFQCSKESNIPCIQICRRGDAHNGSKICHFRHNAARNKRILRHLAADAASVYAKHEPREIEHRAVQQGYACRRVRLKPFTQGMHALRMALPFPRLGLIERPIK